MNNTYIVIINSYDEVKVKRTETTPRQIRPDVQKIFKHVKSICDIATGELEDTDGRKEEE